MCYFLTIVYIHYFFHVPFFFFLHFVFCLLILALYGMLLCLLIIAYVREPSTYYESESKLLTTLF